MSVAPIDHERPPKNATVLATAASFARFCVFQFLLRICKADPMHSETIRVMGLAFELALVALRLEKSRRPRQRSHRTKAHRASQAGERNPER
jgi:hypothetical protein